MRRPRHLANAALTAGLELRAFNPRDTTPLPHGQVDDAPYGGGPGMVLRVDVMAAALEAVYGVDAGRVRDERRVAVLTPRGRPLTDAVARELAQEPALTLLCGRYEGFDERVHEDLANDAISLGPFVLAGGEVAAMAVVDAVGRRMPGALGNAESLEGESFSEALGGGLEHPHYTRPAEFRGQPRAGRPAVRRPRGDRALARGAGDGAAVLSRAPRAARGRPRALLNSPSFCRIPTRHAERGARAMSVIESLEREQLRDDVPDFKAGDTVRVHFRVIEGSRQRVQVFEGTVIRRQGSTNRETFTVRKQSFGVGVERTFPIHSPKIERIQRVMEGDVNRAKLYYLRGKVGKKARIREKQRS